jgi:hypothetical protein
MQIDSDREALMSTLQSVVSAYEVETSHHSLLDWSESLGFSNS